MKDFILNCEIAKSIDFPRGEISTLAASVHRDMSTLLNQAKHLEGLADKLSLFYPTHVFSSVLPNMSAPILNPYL
jgi:predicted component of type VI protein secretion system